MPTSDELLGAIKSFATGLFKGNTVDTLGAPVDLLHALSPKFLQSGNPMGGSKHLRQVFGVNSEDANLGETAGSMLSAGGVVKAMIVGAARLGKISPEVAKAVEKAPELIAEVGNAKAFDKLGVYEDKAYEGLKAVISDKSAKINPDWRKATTVGEALDHPVLFKLYPELKDIPLGESVKGSLGSMRRDNSLMTLDSTMPDSKVKEVALHELQHGVQHIEGFSKGGNSRMFLDFDPGYVQQKISEARKSSDASVRDAAEVFKTRANTKINEAIRAYENLGGEQEARFTQGAMNKSYDEVNALVYKLLKSGKSPQSFDTQ